MSVSDITITWTRLGGVAKDLQGVIMFCDVASNTATSTNKAVQEAMVEAAIKARSYGYHRIFFLTNSRNLVQIINKKKNPNWQEKTMVANLKNLYQNRLIADLLVVPKVVLDSI